MLAGRYPDVNRARRRPMPPNGAHRARPKTGPGSRGDGGRCAVSVRAAHDVPRTDVTERSTGGTLLGWMRRARIFV